MQLKTVFITLFFVSVVLILFIFNLEKNYKIKMHLDEQSKLFNGIYLSSYNEYHMLADTIFDTLINKPEVLDALVDVTENNPEKMSQARGKLYLDLIQDYTLLKTRYVEQLQFHLPNNKSFLRMHSPDLYGDDLSKIRKTVVFVNKYHKAIDGFEGGKISNGFRFVYPLSYQNKHLGSVEISFNVLSVLTKIMKDHKVLANILVSKSIVDFTASEEKAKRYQPSPLKGFYFEKKVVENLNQNFNPPKYADEMQNKIGQKIDAGKLFSVYNKKQDRIITFIPIKNPNNHKVVAYIMLNFYDDYIHNKIVTFQTLVVINIALSALFFFFIYREILSKRKLKERDNKTRSILNRAASMIILTDRNIILEANNAFFAFFDDYENIESFNKSHKNLCELFHPMDENNYVFCNIHSSNNWFDLIVDNKSSTFKAVIQKNGHNHYFVLNASTIWIDNLSMVLVELTNITNEIKLAEQLKLKDIQLFEQHKLAQMGEMIHNIAHQWRQPLAIITVLTAIIKEKFLNQKITSAELVDKLAVIDENTEYMSETIDDFMNFHQSDKIKKLFDIQESIKAAVRIVQPLLTSYKIKTEMSLDSCIANGNEREFSQVILAILSNAKDVLIENKIQEPFIAIALYHCNQQFEVTIEDNGGGIKNEYITKIFDPYFSTKQSKRGTGLGLYITKIIIEKSMNGSIQVENTDKGAKFIIKVDK